MHIFFTPRHFFFFFVSVSVSGADGIDCGDSAGSTKTKETWMQKNQVMKVDQITRRETLMLLDSLDILER